MQRSLVSALLLAAVHPMARAADIVASFTLPSRVEITIVEAPLAGDVYPNCSRSGTGFVFRDYRPRTYVKSITGQYKGKTFTLDSTCMTDAWNGRPLEVKGVVRYFGGHCTIDHGTLFCSLRGIFADASESFVAEWSVTGTSGLRTVMSGSSDIIHLFMKNIDPPEYE